MLMPKRVKRRRVHRGRMKGKATRGNKVTYGEYGLVSTEPGWITSNQIEAARIAMTRSIKRGGKVYIKIFPHKSVTKKPAEVRMGSGKGAPEYWVAVRFDAAAQAYEAFHDLIDIVRIEAFRRERRTPVFLGDSYDYVTAAGIVYIVCKGADSVHDRSGIEPFFVLNASRFDDSLVDKVFDVDRQRHGGLLSLARLFPGSTDLSIFCRVTRQKVSESRRARLEDYAKKNGVPVLLPLD